MSANHNNGPLEDVGDKAGISIDTVMREANTLFELERRYRKEALLMLANSGLVSETADEIESQFMEPDFSEPAGVIAELDALSGSAPRPDYRLASKEISLSKMRAKELSGETYPETVEIIYPPQVAEKYGSNGVVLPTRDVLRWLAKCRDVNPERKRVLREIAHQYYSK